MGAAMTAKTTAERSEKAAKKRKAAGEEELRLWTREGTRQALAELMEWAGIEEQGEAMTLMIHNLHKLGHAKALSMLELPPRHEIEVSPKWARIIEQSNARQALRICAE